MAKTFPIQVVKTRGKQDIFKKEAGGSNELPDWVNDDAVRVNSSIIISQLNDLEGELERKMKEKTPVPILMTATLHEKQPLNRIVLALARFLIQSKSVILLAWTRFAI